MKRVQVGGFLALGLAAALAAGCGDDDNPTGGGGDLSFTVRQGTWSLSQTAYFSGPDSACDVTPISSDTLEVLCNYEITEPGLPGACELTQNGNDVDFSCTITQEAPPCRLVQTISGSGTVTETSLDLTLAATVQLQADPGQEQVCEILYGDPSFACTLWVEVTGNWVSSDGDSVCDQTAPGPVPLASFLSRVSGSIWESR